MQELCSIRTAEPGLRNGIAERERRAAAEDTRSTTAAASGQACLLPVSKGTPGYVICHDMGERSVPAARVKSWVQGRQSQGRERSAGTGAISPAKLRGCLGSPRG